MIRLNARGFLNPRSVTSAVERAARRVLARQGAFLRGVARRLIRRRKDPTIHAPAGKPPYTHTGALKHAIVFAVGRDSVVIGPTFGEIGLVGHTHEFGGRFRGAVYPERPFMGPALDIARPKLAQFWKDSVRR